jgi:phosphoglycolate phosphatase
MPKLIDCIEAVAFDLDGTLIDTAPDLGAAVNMMLVILGGRPVPEQSVPGMIGGGIDRLVTRALTLSRGMAPSHALHEGAAAMFRNLYRQRLFERSRVYPGVVETLRTLDESCVKVCCVTNKESRFALPLLEAAGLGKYLWFTLCADSAEDRKPSPNMLRAACTRFGVEPAQMLCIGDSRSDIVAARAAGCRVVAVDYGYHHDVSLSDLQPDGVVSSVRDVLDLHVRAQAGSGALRAIA